MGPSNEDRTTRRDIPERRELTESLEVLASDMSSVRLHTKEPGRKGSKKDPPVKTVML